jgi:hypothetical protein
MTEDRRNQVELPRGVTWKRKVTRNDEAIAMKAASKKLPSLAALNKRMAATRARRLADGEANAMRMLGRKRL